MIFASSVITVYKNVSGLALSIGCALQGFVTVNTWADLTAIGKRRQLSKLQPNIRMKTFALKDLQEGRSCKNSAIQ